MAGISTKTPGASSVRRKQLIIVAGLVLVIAVIAFGAAMMSTQKVEPPARAPESTRKTFGAQGEPVNQADIWRTQEGARVSELQQQLADIQTRVLANEKTISDGKAKEQERAAQAEAEELERLERERELRNRPSPPPTGLPMQTAPLGQIPNPSPSNEQPPERIKGIMRIDMTPDVNSPSSRTPSSNAAANTTGNTPAGSVKGDQTAESYIPAGTFMRGVLLSGLDAPTGGQAQQNPHPVVIEVLDMASLPNKFKADYKNCRFTANGAGDLSSERAYIRLDRLSCISEDGGALDVSVRGYIADQTGKAGIRGRLVSKQGQVLANALLAGVASGIGTAFAQSATTTSISPLGATQSAKDGQQIQAGFGQGVGNALQQLSRYYIQLADKVFPIIEIDAGQPIDIVITKGISVARK